MRSNSVNASSSRKKRLIGSVASFPSSRRTMSAAAGAPLKYASRAMPNGSIAEGSIQRLQGQRAAVRLATANRMTVLSFAGLILRGSLM